MEITSKHWTPEELTTLNQIMDDGIAQGLRPATAAAKAGHVLNRTTNSCYQRYTYDMRDQKRKDALKVYDGKQEKEAQPFSKEFQESLDNVVGKYIPRENTPSTLVLKGEVRIPFTDLSIDMVTNELVIKL